MKVSIVTAYYNRKPQFYETLKSIKRSEYNNYEVIVADDGSSDEHRLEDLIEEFPFLKIIRLENEDKWYINPCVPFNKAINEAIGDILILQNPECLHVHDIISFVSKNINNSNYISFAAYGIDLEMTESLKNHNENNTVNDFYNKLPQRSYEIDGVVGYYNHSKYRKTHYHFCSAISKDNMNKLNGFDERYAHGIGYDDMELIYRIQLLRLNIILNDDKVVIHQFHKKSYDMVSELHQKNLGILNKTLFNNKTIKSTEYRVN